MKRRELLKQLRKIAGSRGETFSVTEGGNHSKVMIGKQLVVVPRHREISEMTAKVILKETQNG